MGSSESTPDTAEAQKDVVSGDKTVDLPAPKAVPSTAVGTPPQIDRGEGKDESDGAFCHFDQPESKTKSRNPSDNFIPLETALDKADRERPASGLLLSPQKAIPDGTLVDPSDTTQTSRDASNPGVVTGSDAGLAVKPMTLTDLFSGQTSNNVNATTAPWEFRLENTHFGYWSQEAELAGAYQTEEMWSSQPWYDYTSSPTLDWDGAYVEPSFSYPAPDYGETLPIPAPPPILGVTPDAAGQVSGLGRDSPRSVVLTLCGAWGALKTPTDASRKDRLSKQDLLSYRRVMPRGSRPKPLKSLRTVY